MSGDWQVPRRRLGRTGLETSVLGLGGFHQVEVTQDIVNAVLERFLGAGGNYVESAVGYGKGAAESKIGTALLGHRDRVILVSKTAARTAEEARRELDGSLRRLRTDYLDILIFHCISDAQTLDVVTGPGGAAEAFIAAREQGLVRHTAVSTHWPKILPEVINRLPVEAIMLWVNYLARCNYPEIERNVIPAARRQGLGVIGMKPVGDGYLYRSVRDAFTYALSRDVDVLASGFNSLELLEADLQVIRGYSQCDARQVQDILRNSPELGDYVCRQCEHCCDCQAGVNIPLIFELEGKFDQQMADGRPHDAADYALRERLKHWFGNQETAKRAYAELAVKADACLEAGHRHSCPYGIDITRKLRLAHQKLTGQYLA